MFDLKDFFDNSAILTGGDFAALGKTCTRTPACLTFCVDSAYLREALGNANVSSLLLSRRLLGEAADATGKGIVVVDDPRGAFWTLHNRLVVEQLVSVPITPGIGVGCKIHPSAVIARKAQLSDGVSVGPNAVIEDYTVLGEGCHVGPGVVLGAEGMQTFAAGDRRVLVRHAGGVRLGGGVSVLANAVVSKGVRCVFTEIGDGTTVSLLSSVGHESCIGRNCSVAGNALIGGSVEIGDDVWIGPGVCISDAVRIGSRAQIKLGSVVIRDVGEGQVVSGNFAMEHARNLRQFARTAR